jgi:hypothetical protein
MFGRLLKFSPEDGGLITRESVHMADIKMTQLRKARVRALRVAAAYASMRELSETEFRRLVDDLAIASAQTLRNADDPPTP